MSAANQPPDPSLQPPPPDADDRALMSAIATGDREAFSRFYDRFSPPVFAYCLRALRDRGEAEDLLLDIFAELWERSGQYDPSLSKPFTYLMTLTRARLIDRLRSRRSRRLRGGPAGAAPNPLAAGAEELEASAGGPLLQTQLAEQRSRVLRAMEELTPDQRTVVELAYFDALTHSEIAEKLGRPLGTVKSRIRQAMGRLRDLLSGDQP